MKLGDKYINDNKSDYPIKNITYAPYRIKINNSYINYLCTPHLFKDYHLIINISSDLNQNALLFFNEIKNTIFNISSKTNYILIEMLDIFYNIIELNKGEMIQCVMYLLLKISKFEEEYNSIKTHKLYDITKIIKNIDIYSKNLGSEIY